MIAILKAEITTLKSEMTTMKARMELLEETRPEAVAESGKKAPKKERAPKYF
jgi:cell division protein FtsB